MEETKRQHGDKPQKLLDKKKALQQRQNEKSDGTPLEDLRKMKKLRKKET